jgi:hypothetical protein
VGLKPFRASKTTHTMQAGLLRERRAGCARTRAHVLNVCVCVRMCVCARVCVCVCLSVGVPRRAQDQIFHLKAADIAAEALTAQVGWEQQQDILSRCALACLRASCACSQSVACVCVWGGGGGAQAHAGIP